MCSIDRIGRSATDVMRTVDDLLARGVSIWSITDGIDQITKKDSTRLNLIAAYAEHRRP